jgi:hypothetical protein
MYLVKKIDLNILYSFKYINKCKMSPTDNKRVSPPSPPSPEDAIYYSDLGVPGKFLYVENIDIRRLLQNTWIAVSHVEGAWDFIKRDIESFTWSTDPIIGQIYDEMIAIGYDEHSGYSFGCGLRELQYIAKHGEKAYIKHYLLSKNCSSRD